MIKRWTRDIYVTIYLSLILISFVLAEYLFVIFTRDNKELAIIH